MSDVGASESLTRADCLGEFTGTCILVFFGCGAVAVTVLFSAHSGLLQVAAVWGTAVTLAIYSTRHLSCAHLNPAVSLAVVVAGRMTFRKLPVYVVGQQYMNRWLVCWIMFQAVELVRMQSCPAQAVFPLVGLAADKITRDWYNCCFTSVDCCWW